jgi:uncharacterized membrane protein YGL010W
MSVRSHLLAWQWRIYPGNHRHRANLLIHIVAVPLFWLGLACAIAVIAGASLWYLAVSAGLVVAAFLLQGAGHKREIQKPEPFLGADDLVSRFVVEQLITFPRFVLSGNWLRNLRA